MTHKIWIAAFASTFLFVPGLMASSTHETTILVTGPHGGSYSAAFQLHGSRSADACQELEAELRERLDSSRLPEGYVAHVSTCTAASRRVSGVQATSAGLREKNVYSTVHSTDGNEAAQALCKSFVTAVAPDAVCRIR